LPCSCGGAISRMGWREHIVFNVVFVGLTVLAIRREAGRGVNASN
jgi:hypothetical protein